MTSEKRTQIIASLATLLFFIAVFAVLFTLTLRYTGNEPRVWPPEDTSELLLTGEYVKVGDMLQPEQTSKDQAASSTEADLHEADDMVDAGIPAPEPAPVITSRQESPAKVKEKPKPEKTGPTKAEIEAREKAKREKETADKINSRVNFGGTSSGTSSTGTSGSPDGNSNVGALKGTPGYNLRGRSLESWAKPSGSAIGTITVRVRVNRQGQVVEASFASGSGAVSGSESARRSCINAARQSKFSVDLNAAAEQVGTITYRFE